MRASAPAPRSTVRLRRRGTGVKAPLESALSRCRHLVGRGGPQVPVLLQALHQKGGQRWRAVGPAQGDVSRFFGEMRRQQLLRGPAGERRLPGQHFVAQRAEGIEVCAMVDVGIGGDLFRRHSTPECPSRALPR